jgi:hypothetical protein
MTRLDMVRLAVGELGNAATAEQIDRFIIEQFGQQLGVRFIPIYRATLRGEEQLRLAREMAATLIAEDRASSTKPTRTPGRRPSRAAHAP